MTLPADLEPKLRDLVAHAGRKHPRAYAQRDDLLQEARLACWLALPRVDPARGDPTPFLMVRARGAVLDALRKEGGHFGLGGAASAVRSGRGLGRRFERSLSLEAEREEKRFRDPADPGADELVRAVDVREEVDQVLAGLSRRDRVVLLLHLGELATMREVGETVGLSESRISQLEGALVKRLREAASWRE